MQTQYCLKDFVDALTRVLFKDYSSWLTTGDSAAGWRRVSEAPSKHRKQVGQVSIFIRNTFRHMNSGRFSGSKDFAPAIRPFGTFRKWSLFL
jgi:hypothetical protein